MRFSLFLLVMFLGFPGTVFAIDSPTREFGLRGGFEAQGLEENYTVGEIYFDYGTPWRPFPAAGENLSLWFEIAAAQLDASVDEGQYLAVGGSLVYAPGGGPLEIELGWRPTWLSDYRFGEDDLGGQLQFSSHIGLALAWQPIRIGYRYQHTSNAGIYEENPGLDLHLFGVGFRF
ncbi:MAG TPA: acyloxyacyl hydrolase [Desulfuromonadales bacterium]|nr:acyloxyacyl hydrolase [Desulfuromonadales bacterium]